ncbi:aminopeptidase N [Sulfurimonas sp.]|uniref:aminopeptidase N n=1 Tax=Sulfurimonas sp. TaxID=2022749 RepID=UPI00356287EB
MVKTIYLKDYKKPYYKVKSLDLTFELEEEFTTVTNVMQIKSQEIDPAFTLKLDSIDLELLEIYINDLKIDDTRYSYKDEVLSVNNVPAEFTLKIKNKIYPQNNTELEGLYKSGSIFCTQNEPEGFRRITPYIDRPDVMSVYTTTVIADKKRYPVLLANGNKKTTSDLGDKHSVTWFDPHPKPSYLFALVAGDLGSITDSFTTMGKKEIELNIYCDLGNESKCYHAMKSLKDAMLWDEQKYGREYDLDIYNIVAVDSFNMGAMENKGLNIFNSHYVLANEELATDRDFMGIQSVIAHEYFHNWTGNRITCRDWFQLTLKEGLTVFRDQCFSADLNSKEVQRIEDVKALRDRQFVEDASPTSHPIQPESYISMNNFYTATVYEKGAEVIRMIHTLLGEKNYRKATDLYFQSFDGQAVTTKDFLWAMSEASEVDLTQFERWYHQNGTPRLLVSEKYENGTYTLRLTQVIPNTLDGKAQKAYYFPLKIALLEESGRESLEEIIIVSKEFEEFTWKLPSKPILSINRDFSAPVIIKQEKNDYPFLSRHDSNSFVKYESMQSYAIETLEDMMNAKEINEDFVKTYGFILDAKLDLSFKALVLELPSISTLMQRQEVVDFEPLYEVREKLKKHLASVYRDKLIVLYKQNHQPKNDAIDSQSMGERAIKNRVLKMLSALEDVEITALAYDQYENSVTMTDKIIALDILENTTQKESAIALADFYSKYKKDTLVMNKYFAILSASERAGTLDRVMALQNDEAYDEKVPNLVRSLIGVFARNYKHFHAKDGLGYKFVADKILEIDKINAQMASALAGAFKIYEKMNDTNKALIKTELERIVSVESLSKNSYEIISKILKK